LSLSILYLTILTLFFSASGPASTSTSDPTITPLREDSISIGLLIPDPSYNKIIREAEMAIQKANQKGAYKGRPFKLVVRTTEGPWGAGSKESVSLVYEDEVCAYVGSLDGRNAHLAEQVAAKSHLAYLETRATDPTLSQAYVPWFMRMVPSDDQQARALLDLIGEEEAGKIAILSREDYDTRYAVKSLDKFASREFGINPYTASLDPEDTEIQKLITQILESGSNHLIIPFCSEAVFKVLAGLRKLKPELKLYGTLAFSYDLEKLGTDRDKLNRDMQYLDGMILVHSYAESSIQLILHPTELSAAYAADGVRLIVAAVHTAGPDRQSISKFILTQDHPGSKTGPCRFDDLGNRCGELRFIQVRKGKVADFRLEDR